MLTDITTIVRKEFHEIFLMRGSLRSGITNVLLLLAVIGILMPIISGAEWLTNPVGALVWSWLPIFSSMGIIADLIAGERERHTLETLLASRLSDRAILFGKIGATVLYAWMLAIGSMLIGAITINVAFPTGALQFYQASIFFGALLGSFLVALLLAAIGVLVSLNAENARQAYQKLSIVMIVVWVLPALLVQFLPRTMLQRAAQALDGLNLTALLAGGGVLLLAVTAVVLAIAMARFKRSRLILD